MITTVIFDFAGVLTTKRCFFSLAEKLGKGFRIPKETILTKLHAKESRYAAGKESTRAFWNKTCAKLGIPYDDFVAAFSFWYVLNRGTIALARRLSKRYTVVMHSDNFAVVTSVMRRDKKLKNLFTKIYLSNEIHMLKAHKKTFRWIATQLGKAPQECVFIDDQKNNLAVARSVGMRTILFMNVAQVRNDLKRLGVTI